MPVRPESFLRSNLGLSERNAESICTVIHPIVSILILVYPLTFAAIVYLLIEEDTPYRARILEVLIGANILAILPYFVDAIVGLLNGRLSAAVVAGFFVLMNPAIFLSIVYAIDQSNWVDKKFIGNSLLGVSVTLTVLLVMPAQIFLNYFNWKHCSAKTGKMIF